MGKKQDEEGWEDQPRDPETGEWISADETDEAEDGGGEGGGEGGDEGGGEGEGGGSVDAGSTVRPTNPEPDKFQ